LNDKLNIVLLGTAYPFRGGLAAFNERLARQLMAEGHRVEIITFTTQYPSFLFPGKTQMSTEAAPTDLSIRRAVHSCHPLTWWKVGRELRKQRPDLVICCYWMAFFAPAFATIERIVKRNGHTKCLALVHNMIPHEPTILDKLFAPAFVRNTDGFVALSKSVVEDIRRVERRNLSVHELSELNELSVHELSELNECNGSGEKPKTFSPHPIYDHYGEAMTKAEACEALGLNKDNEYLLFFGLVRAYKGLDLLIDAFALVKDELPEFRLIIAGEFYEDEQKYRSQIHAAGLDERVIVRNEFIPDDDLRKYFGAASLIVQPYRSATQSGVTQVAYHFEKPMLVTDVGGLAEIVPDGKVGYVCPVDARAIAEALRKFAAIPADEREQLFRENIRKEKKKYAWSAMTKAILGLTLDDKE